MENKYTHYTENELIREAYQVQNACNLSGVVHSFSEVIQRLRELYKHKLSTDEINTHLICRLFANKIASLTGDVLATDWANERSYNPLT